MTFDSLHKILDDPSKKLTKEQLSQIVYELRNDTLDEQAKLLTDLQEKHDMQKYMVDNSFYRGEQNAFQLVLDLIEHLGEE